MENIGNNNECIKALRLNVQLYNSDTLNNVPNIRYYFPETPELNGKTIVGIKANAGSDIAADLAIYGVTPFDLPDFIQTENSQGIAQEPAGPHPLLSTDIDKYLYVTIYNSEHEQVLSNYPMHDLASYSRNDSGFYNVDSFGKIRPFDFKINIRECFVVSSGVLSALTIYPPIACFTFYYK